MTFLELAISTWVSLAPLETGVASVYSIETNNQSTVVACKGKQLSDADLVAAHKSLPCGTRVAVINLDNLKTTEVVIIDRGPYVAGRIIDLSLAAAKAIQLPGLGPVAITKK